MSASAAHAICVNDGQRESEPTLFRNPTEAAT